MPMQTLQALFRYIKQMHRATYLFLKASIIVSCICLIAATALHLAAYRTDASPLTLIHLADELGQMPQAIVLLAAIGSACMEDMRPH